MNKMTIKLIIIYLVVFALFIGILWLNEAHGEDVSEINDLIVIADTLNGRYRPNKKSVVLAIYSFGDHLIPTGKWSQDHAWVEVYHPEEKTLWVSINYISERMDIFTVFTLNDAPIRARSKPGIGKTTKYIKKDQLIEVDQVIMGYGHTQYGWVDLSYFIEDEAVSTAAHKINKK